MQEERKAIKEQGQWKDKSKGRNQKKREKLSRDEIHFCKEKKEKKKKHVGIWNREKEVGQISDVFLAFLESEKAIAYLEDDFTRPF